MIITYTGHDEILVATIEQEHKLINDFFTEGGRELDDYDRAEFKDLVQIELNVGKFLS